MAAVGASLSNRDRRKLKKAKAVAPRVVAGDPTVRVAAEPEPVQTEADRDYLVWLAKKQRIVHSHAKAGLHFRDLFRHVIDYSGADVPSCVERLKTAGGGGKVAGLSGATYTAAVARRELFRIRWVVLGGDVDVLTAMDGVCGIGHSVAYLAGGVRLREIQLLQSLKIGLSLLAADIARSSEKQD